MAKEKDATASLTLLEHAHITEMQQDLDRRLQESKSKEAGRIDSLRMSVLADVVAQNYDVGTELLKGYVDEKSAYPVFQDRVARYVEHCANIIQAIQTKRNFPGLATLSLSKQQEIHEKVLEHFEELKHNLRHIEKIERDAKLTDVRSTVWVLKSASVTVAAIVIALFVADLRDGSLDSVISVTNIMLDDASTWFVNKIIP